MFKAWDSKEREFVAVRRFVCPTRTKQTCLCACVSPNVGECEITKQWYKKSVKNSSDIQRIEECGKLFEVCLTLPLKNASNGASAEGASAEGDVESSPTSFRQRSRVNEVRSVASMFDDFFESLNPSLDDFVKSPDDLFESPEFVGYTVNLDEFSIEQSQQTDDQSALRIDFVMLGCSKIESEAQTIEDRLIAGLTTTLESTRERLEQLSVEDFKLKRQASERENVFVLTRPQRTIIELDDHDEWGIDFNAAQQITIISVEPVTSTDDASTQRVNSLHLKGRKESGYFINRMSGSCQPLSAEFVTPHPSKVLASYIREVPTNQVPTNLPTSKIQALTFRLLHINFCGAAGF